MIGIKLVHSLHGMKTFPCGSIWIELSSGTVDRGFALRDFSRDGDTARRGRYTSRRRVANFPRRGFSIIPLAARLRRGEERLCGWRRLRENGETRLMVVVEMTASSRFPLSLLHRSTLEPGIPRQRVGPFGSQGRHGNVDHPLFPFLAFLSYPGPPKLSFYLPFSILHSPSFASSCILSFPVSLVSDSYIFLSFYPGPFTIRLNCYKPLV